MRLSALSETHLAPLFGERQFFTGIEPLLKNDFAVFAFGNGHGFEATLQLIGHFIRHVDSDSLGAFSYWVRCHLFSLLSFTGDFPCFESVLPGFDILWLVGNGFVRKGLADNFPAVGQRSDVAHGEHLHDDVTDGSGFDRASDDLAPDGIRCKLAERFVLTASSDNPKGIKLFSAELFQRAVGVGIE
jgi:hypothetical protein